eukprot:m.3567 g.3567  ORF g.3567 m.3567 type:complete len:156 (+) comp9563_c0_seq1:114-581(+)
MNVPHHSGTILLVGLERSDCYKKLNQELGKSNVDVKCISVMDPVLSEYKHTELLQLATSNSPCVVFVFEQSFVAAFSRNREKLQTIRDSILLLFQRLQAGGQRKKRTWIILKDTSAKDLCKFDEHLSSMNTVLVDMNGTDIQTLIENLTSVSKSI